jgi:hypothetical protein
VDTNTDHVDKPWYYGKMAREVCPWRGSPQAAEEELLAAAVGFDGGLFIVRDGRSPGTYALSWCHEGKVSHTLVPPPPRSHCRLFAATASIGSMSLPVAFSIFEGVRCAIS